MNARPTLTRAKWLIGCAAASIAIGAHAQAAGESADTLLRDSDAVFKQLDAGQYGAVWSDAAPFVKARFKQDQFAAQMQQARQSVGAVSHRGWAQVTRIRYERTTGMPDGLYANVDYATTLASGATMFEKLSFRLETDGRWHLTGYVPRQTQNAAQ
ncbi:DUF4019 domain-containing protein [Burkholderia cenocepacia]|uniref:DUF4019 domain-containing protein n=1 Tax=Burkholderia cenocepacia TaxID=95486 RepID=UPI00196B2E96|nr:DUF4019 domain-containing protein [Burkholderia cenocepacia]MBN3506664.1 DUF4019 domain-containing protein [Burkholderia cenocepacia]MCO1392278.1 DUF4019 domain-containing protein [Burkholderia cenocepacia]MCO1406905.1 DUF4019 domain-containing protein [Burkholderia cenocepacia]MDV3102264.1 DUF4019 domain-containing protein [Burkholderia cenocepacia]UQN95717.1 DUF4019 domain-containing protein [Burkholderia cenocepacia]